MNFRVLIGLLSLVVGSHALATTPASDIIGGALASTHPGAGTSSGVSNTRLMVQETLERGHFADPAPKGLPVLNSSYSSVDVLPLAPVSDHWLKSRLDFAGNTVQDDQLRRGHLGLEARGLLVPEHTFRFNFNESAALQAGNESESLAFGYAFPVAGQRINIDARTSQYSNAVTGNDGKFQASGDGRHLNLNTRRSMFSLGGMAVDSVLTFSSDESSRFERGIWKEDRSTQRSIFQLEGSAQHDLWFDVKADTRLSASQGVEVSCAENNNHERRDDGENFQKLSVYGRLSRQAFQWDLGMSGKYQYSQDELPGSQHLQLVGPGMISGLDGQSLKASQGGWMRLDADSPSFNLPGVQHARSNVQLSVLHGWSRDLSAAEERAAASAAEISFNVRRRGVDAGLKVGRMLDGDGSVSRKPDRPDVSFSLSVGL